MDEIDDERKVELVKEFYDLDISHDINDFDNVDCTVYNESSADGYDLFVITNNPKHVSICEDVYYYDHDLTERFNEHIRWGDRTFYIERYLYDDCYFEDYIANDMFNDLVNGSDFNGFLEDADLTLQELKYLKEEYGIEDEETTEA
tara:strand:- start:143 stop:580 length:438 start_codon:yes stop_codon:yes gene_type:complete